MKKLYSIEGVKCGGCAAVVKEKVSDIEGVESVSVDVAATKLIRLGTVETQGLQEALSDTKCKINYRIRPIKIISWLVFNYDE